MISAASKNFFPISVLISTFMAGGKKKMYNQPCSTTAMIFPSWYSVIEKLIHSFAGSPYMGICFRQSAHRIYEGCLWRQLQGQSGASGAEMRWMDKWRKQLSPHRKSSGHSAVGRHIWEQNKRADWICPLHGVKSPKIYLDVPKRSIAYAAACLPALAANIANATEHNALDKVFLVPKVVT